jgi:hypothetical protein
MKYIAKLFKFKSAANFLDRVTNLRQEAQQSADNTADLMAAIDAQIEAHLQMKNKLFNDHYALTKIIDKLDNILG